MTSIDDADTNLQFILNAIYKLDPKTRLLCLPENSLYLKLEKDPLKKERAFTKDSSQIKALQKIAKERNLNIHMGGIPWLIKDKVYNEALLITDQGEIKETYEKMHLFDVNLGPGLEVCESASFSRGQRLTVIEIDGWRLATCICYDVRFPELFVHYMENEKVDAFIVPAAFTTKTGELHWKALLQARAIETQAYVLAAAQVGYHRDKAQTQLRKSWGQSLIFNPWGKVLKESASYEAFLDSHLTEHDPMPTVLERAEIDSYHQSVPVSSHRYYKMELVKK